MNNKKVFFLGVLAAGMLSFQISAMAEAIQGTIYTLDTGSHRMEIKPSGDAEPETTVKILTAPGVKYIGVESFDDFLVGDFVKIQALSKSKTGDALEAVSIEKTMGQEGGVYSVVPNPVVVSTRTTTIVETSPVSQPAVIQEGSNFFRGEIKKIDESTNEITITDMEGKDRIVAVNERTLLIYKVGDFIEVQPVSKMEGANVRKIERTTTTFTTTSV